MRPVSMCRSMGHAHRGRAHAVRPSILRIFRKEQCLNRAIGIRYSSSTNRSDIRAKKTQPATIMKTHANIVRSRKLGASQ